MTSKPAAESLVGLPGNPSTRQWVEQTVRVNHAGEYGAQRIYEGQLAVLGHTSIGPILHHMADQEKAHLAAFDALLVQRQIRPTALQPLWHVAGFALGAFTAFLGPKAAMACTVAVEEVIDQHYQQQLDQLPPHEELLGQKIRQFQAEELEHRDIGLQHEAEKTPGYSLLTTLIKTGSRAAIWLSKRI